MSAALRPRRCLLFCPGPEWRKIEKASGLDVDGVIIDLEDAAALNQKPQAREITSKALAELDFGTSERLVRVNPVATGLTREDIEVTSGASGPPDGYVVPKVESGDNIRFVSNLLDEVENDRGLDAGTIGIMALIETAKGVVNLKEITQASDRLVALIFGAEDLRGDIGARPTVLGYEVAYAKSAVVVHAKAAGLQAIDTPWLDLTGSAGMLPEVRVALDMGYDGKLAIHPKHIKPIVGVFTPTEEEIAVAKRLIAEHDQHQAEGRGVFSMDGRMVDMPMVRAAQRVLDRAGLG
jgi:citrate lyase beta subunit